MAASTSWRPEGLVEHFREMDVKMQDRRFCFVLGAGASRSSGIPVGSELVRRWLSELHRREDPATSFETWLTRSVGIAGFDPADPARFYPQVFERRFAEDADEGYAWLEDAMRAARPSFGYFVLARILSDTRHRIVITTNFDNLVAESLVLGGSEHPLICGHESLAGFARTSPRRPLIAKIHRDLLLAPVNDEVGVAKLAPGWVTALERILGAYTPIFLGYGGNDGSLMGFLEQLGPRHVPGRPVWCYWEKEQPTPRVLALMERLRGILVPIRDFDSLMMDINDAMGWDMPITRLENRAREQIDWFKTEAERMVRGAPRVSETPDAVADTASARSVEGSVARTEGPWQVVLRAQMTGDVAQQRGIFEDGLQRYPGDPPLRLAFAEWLLQHSEDLDRVAELLRGLDERVPEVLLQRANLAVRQGQAARRAGQEVAAAKAWGEAAESFEAAARADGRRPATLVAWANFLTDVRGEHAHADALYREAVDRSGRRDPAVLCDHAVFLTDVTGDLAAAEALYGEALAIEPDNPSFLANLAELLLRSGRPDAAWEAASRLWDAAAGDRSWRAVAAWIAAVASSVLGLEEERLLARLKSCLPLPRGAHFSFDRLLAALEGLVSPDRVALYRWLAGVLTHPQAQALRDVSPDGGGRWSSVVAEGGRLRGPPPGLMVRHDAPGAPR